MVRIDALFLTNTFMMSNAMMELAKKKTNAEQHPEVKL